jgi:hypothetical protein
VTVRHLERRVARLESDVTGPRMGFTLEQLVLGSLGLDAGAPARVLRDGDVDLEALVATAEPVRGAR